MPLREVPNNIEAEQAVIGSMFLDIHALEKACDSLTPESFYFNNNSKIFKTIQDMHEEKIPIDFTTVTTELKNKNILTEELQQQHTLNNILNLLKIVLCYVN